MKIIVLVILSISSFLSYGQFFKTVWETDKVLKTPESVLYNQQRNEIYVSNINGNPTDKDGNGFITLMDTTGKIIKLEWIPGLNAPKGMAVLGDSLIVTDIDRIHVISIHQVKIIQTITVEGAGFLNDVVVLDDGTAYITDMAENKIMMFKDGKVDLWLTDTLLVKPNGLALTKKDIAVGVKNSILRINKISKEIKVAIDETGSVDGLINLGGNKFIISDWSGRIMMVSPSEKIVLSNTSDSDIQAADLGYIPDKKWVLTPTFFDNRVVASQLP